MRGRAIGTMLAFATGLGLACAREGTPPRAPEASQPPAHHGAARPAVAPTTSDGWTNVRIADGCDVRVADAPESIELALPWRACPDRPVDCREMSAKLATDAGDAGLALEGLTHRGEVTVAALLFLPGPRARYVLAPRDGQPFAVIEGDRGERCSLGTVGLSDDGAVIEVVYDAKDGYASRGYLRGPLAKDPAWSRVSARLLRSEFPEFIGEAVLSAGGRVVVAGSGGPLRWLDERGRWREVARSHDGWACCFEAHGDRVTFLVETIPERTMAAKIGEAAEPWRTPGSAAGTSPIAIDGDRVVWIQGRDRDNNNIYASIELWQGELSPTFAIVGAKKIAALPRTTMTVPKLGGGNVLVATSDDGRDLALFPIAGGDPRALELPPGNVVERLAWIAADEVVVQIGPGGMHAEPSTFRRLAVRSLPPLPDRRMRRAREPKDR